MRLLQALTVACLVTITAATAPAAGIGTVKTANGEARLERGGKGIQATVGLAVEKNDEVVTGADGSVGITFVDQTMITVGPDAHVVIDDYLYAPNDGQLSFVARLMQGTLFYVSGLIAKTEPDAVTLATPDGTVGIRGTRVAIKVDPPNRWLRWLGFSSSGNTQARAPRSGTAAPAITVATSQARRRRTSW